MKCISRIAVTIAFSIAAGAHAEVLHRLSEGMWVWNGGSATRLGNTWVGSGWDRFPGVNPPWNPVTPPAPIMPNDGFGLTGPLESFGAYEWGASVRSVVPMPEAPLPAPDVQVLMPAPLVIVLPAPAPPPPPLELMIGGRLIPHPRLR